MAMNIISKDKKEIRWLGLPTNSIQECTSLEKEKNAKLESINKKTQYLQDLILRVIQLRLIFLFSRQQPLKGKKKQTRTVKLPKLSIHEFCLNCVLDNFRLTKYYVPLI